MPEIACPDPQGMETIHQLAKDSLDAITHVGQEAWSRLLLLGSKFEGRQELQPLGLQSF